MLIQRGLDKILVIPSVGLRMQSQQVGVFSPADIASLQLWLKADVGMFQDVAKTIPAVNDGDVVGAWEDQSGNGNDVTQPTTSKKPALKLNIVNERPVVRFDGTDDYLAFSRISTIRTVFWVFGEDVAAGDTDRRCVLGDSAYYDFHRQYVAPVPRAFWHASYSAAAIRNGALRLNGGSIVDGTVTAVPSVMTIVSLVTTGNVRGNQLTKDRATASRSWYGDIAELIVYGVALSDGEREAVEGYLNKRYEVY